MSRVHGMISDAIAAIPALAPERMDDALQAAIHIQDRKRRDEVLGALARRFVALEDGFRALDVIEAIDDGVERARVLVEGAKALCALAGEAAVLDVARTLVPAELRLVVLDRLAHLVREVWATRLVDETWDGLMELPEKERREKLRELAPVIPGRLVDRALAIVDTETNATTRARILVRAVATGRDPGMERAVAAVREVADRTEQVKLWAVLVGQAPEQLAAEAVAAAQSALNLGIFEAFSELIGAVPDAALAKLLERVSVVKDDWRFVDAVEAVGPRWAGHREHAAGALARAHSLRNESERDRALLALAPGLSVEEQRVRLARATQQARNDGPGYHLERWLLIAGLNLALDSGTGDWRRDVLERARQDLAGADRIRAMAWLLSRCTEPLRSEVLTGVLIELLSYEGPDRVALFYALLPHLPLPLLDDISAAVLEDIGAPASERIRRLVPGEVLDRAIQAAAAEVARRSRPGEHVVEALGRALNNEPAAPWQEDVQEHVQAVIWYPAWRRALPSGTKSVFDKPDRDLGPIGVGMDYSTPVMPADPANLLAALLAAVTQPEPAPGPEISTGFAPHGAPSASLRSDQPLAGGELYFFWLGAGADENRIDVTTAALPAALLPDNATLTVVVYGLPGGLEIAGGDAGEIRLEPGGAMVVTRQPDPVASSSAAPAADPVMAAAGDLTRTRLFFAVRAPRIEGRALLRCSVYFRNTLVQSRLITARVMRVPEQAPGALQAELDYQLVQSLRPPALAGITPHSLSMLLGQGQGAGQDARTHSFYFHGAGQFRSTAVLDEHELADLIRRAREALRMVAWGSADPWHHHEYRYGERAPLVQLERDLVRLAICGYRLYDVLINKLAGGYEKAQALSDIMRAPGQVQVVLERSPRAVVPVALIYDHALDTSARYEELRLCAPVRKALEQGEPLDEVECFTHVCPEESDPMVVCPGGFWGYRHALGMPLSTEGASEAPVEIRYRTALQMSVAVSTDPAFTERPGHEQRLRALRPDLNWKYAATRADTLRLLKESEPQLVYFYCHGGLANQIPYIQVGSRSERGITRENLRLLRIRWQNTRPLVFLNGCHTTAVSPEDAIELVSAFVENTAACGVIGTEITIFEPLACAFAEAFYSHVLRGLSIGEAVRAARVSLLGARNPLGLVYIPYVLAGARLQKAPD